ncbi:2-oxoglutarate dehydrogenase complex dihydrolipoyllysine-residue succinyltransferase [Marinihelvus fidelis]|uniref:Dihydrolipoyllysine-residue succinyltransferase component of 2-oxoglutarate dehydrogenase complex n=1 Tax=Marinihelvus fidelis TaxID=2613842 RepID=A0A5N0TFA6_9GAMM|nr:2-oxoglutarate dehydrogenase complex dihydrolipoyllysine-residue succinyltransferase [Marinihelvus fidelis]KAA9133301.1 2-oxoglutarate dehydrogenase complex dihydrolipoyllysine-residue succinyltransferase [Marinihelvus fidelis]
MSIEIKVPVLPESVTDATVAAWHKKPGDTIRRDENLVDLETDKVVLEVPSPVDGVLKSITSDSGETVTSGEVLGVVEEGEVEDAPAAEEAPATAETADKPAAAPAAGGEKLSPATRRIVEEEGVNPSDVPASGRGGRLTKGDVVNFLKAGGPTGPRAEERVKMTRLRSTIAKRLKDAQNTAAILTSFQEVDLKAVQDLRAKYKDTFAETHGTKLGLMSFFVKAVCDALAKYPVVNASLDGDEIVYHGFMDIGIAVSTERGLMVPVLRNAERMSLAQIESGIREYAVAAREGTISLDDLQGGTFSITNGGTFGSMLSTPLLNPPQSAILGMHNIKERPVVVNGDIVVRPIMFLALSYDHRIIDGKDSVQFLVAVKEALEDPARLLLNL